MSTTLLWLLIASAWTPAASDQSDRQLTTPHERPPTHPWKARPTTSPAGTIEHCGAWERDGYKSIQVNVDRRGCNIVGDAANEPSIAVHARDPRKMVIGWRQFDSVLSDFRQAGWAYSHDGGHTWVFNGSLDPGVFGSDPVLAAGPEGEVYYLTINFDETRVFRSFDAGITFPLRTQLVPYLYDKPWMAIDTTQGIGRGNVYVSADYRLLRAMPHSESFQFKDVVMPLWPSLAVGTDGTLYATGRDIAFAWCYNVQKADQDPRCNYIGKFDPDFVIFGGDLGWPNGGLHGMIWVGIAQSSGLSQGNVYLLGNVFHSFEDRVDLAFRKTTDGGITWTDAIRIHDDAINSGAWQWFGMMAVAPNGRIDAVWNDTRNSGHANLSEMFYSFSSDAGQTWSKNFPVSPMFDSWVGWPANQYKIGDYYHMVSDNLGVNVAYAATFNGEQDIYFLRIGPWDCNGNEIDDAVDISELRSRDCNGNQVPDECEYRADINGDGLTTLFDFATFQLNLTGPGSSIPADCTRLLDLDHDGDVDLHDLYLLQHVFVYP